MAKAKWVVGLLAIALFVGSCSTMENPMTELKRAFPGRVDKPAADNNAGK